MIGLHTCWRGYVMDDSVMSDPIMIGQPTTTEAQKLLTLDLLFPDCVMTFIRNFKLYTLSAGNVILFICLLMTACTRNSGVPAEEQNSTPRPARNILSATDFIALSDCHDLPCVQLFMKDLSDDFVHAKPGEFASLYQLAVIDTTGDTLAMPMSTLYVTVDAGADWRMAHTLHHKDLSDQLLQEFATEQFIVSDSIYSRKNAGYRYHYRSDRYPGLVLSHFKTFEPWRARGLYYTVTWPCYVFELTASP